MRSKFFKEPTSGEIPFVKRKVYPRVRFRVERAGFAVYSRQQVEQQARLLLFATFFFQTKKKLNVPLFQKDFYKILPFKSQFILA